MELYNYCIIGGGPAGTGFLDRLMQEGQQSAMLFEGRSELLYTLSFMPFRQQVSAMFPEAATGIDFRQLLLNKKRPVDVLSFGSRLIGVDFKNNSLTINSDGRENRTVSYRNLIIASGCVQSIYGSRFLPGYRGSGIFSTYQTTEMLTHYNFFPGEQFAVLGESYYAEEAYSIAREKGIARVFLSNGKYTDAVPYTEIQGLEGQEHIDGIRIRTPEGKIRHFSVDSLAVDGDFIMEHKMRELLNVEWDIDRWQTKTGKNQCHPDFSNVYIAGDAWKPDFNFMNQYENGYNLAGRIL